MRKVVPSGAILIPPKSKKVFQGKINEVYQWQQELFDGSHQLFEMVKRPDTVIIIGITKNNLILIEEQQPLSPKILKFPTGQVDPSDETTKIAAARELKEETGYEFSKYQLVSVRQPINMEWFIYVYIAWDISSINDPLTEPGEKISVKVMPFAEVKKLSKSDNYFKLFVDIFDQSSSCEGLKRLTAFKGQYVDR